MVSQVDVILSFATLEKLFLRCANSIVIFILSCCMMDVFIGTKSDSLTFHNSLNCILPCL